MSVGVHNDVYPVFFAQGNDLSVIALGVFPEQSAFVYFYKLVMLFERFYSRFIVKNKLCGGSVAYHVNKGIFRQSQIGLGVLHKGAGLQNIKMNGAYYPVQRRTFLVGKVQMTLIVANA